MDKKLICLLVLILNNILVLTDGSPLGPYIWNLPEDTSPPNSNI